MTSEKAISTRGLIESDLGPLRRFTGILDSMPQETKTYKKDPTDETEVGRDSTRVSFNMKDIDVKEAVEPYHFPIYTVNIGQSNRKKSRWGVMSEGVKSDRSVGFNNIADQQYTPEQLDPSNANYVKPSDRMDMKDCIGKRIGWVLCDNEDGRPGKEELFDGRANEGKGGDVPTAAWTVYEIEGVGVSGGGGGSNALDLAIGMLNGSTLAEFNPKALDNPAIRADVKLLQSISMPPSAPTSFANTMVSTGKFTVDGEGTYHKV
ncbi:hypothetical protein LCGC14_0408980 [marine sediment metagenome]|uniref:Uncharacterized protein n=1 Tax=marine sediment metagenome TaxID=412755 RepID=A0A0F9VGK9_9ZZZZ